LRWKRLLRVEDRLKISEEFIDVSNEGRKRKLKWQKRKMMNRNEIEEEAGTIRCERRHMSCIKE